MRRAEIKRKTNETDINLFLDLDSRGEGAIKSGSGFFDHMLKLFAANAGITLSVSCAGDTEVDFHHSVEDIGIALGEALKQALGDKSGINRYGWAALAMDEALILASIDLSGRSFLNFDVEFKAAKLSDGGEAIPALIGSFDTELISEFFAALTRSAAATLHLKKLEGVNSHHIAEGVFKAFGRALKQAVAADPGAGVPSTKGVL
ncbi:MAG: imidazoleglycerol-phosphate dehydratase HisB [Christensenellales bacterium]|jgi:imidazoleglycerol-phosphate dehydratase|nr:imidazoleglycerol-phosphate dehydratase HisB [Clostridia bacterium]HRU83811.1 imidazoleglycerol-phosphate dehydratase HisB [Eubacteriales bacterium]